MAFSHPIRSNPMPIHWRSTSLALRKLQVLKSHKPIPWFVLLATQLTLCHPFPTWSYFVYRGGGDLFGMWLKKFRTKVHVQCTVDHVDGGQKKRGHSQGGCRHPGSRRPRPTFPVQAPRLATISPWSDKMLVLPYSIKDMVSLIMGFMSTKPLFAVKNIYTRVILGCYNVYFTIAHL